LRSRCDPEDGAGKASELALRVTIGATTTPVPLRPTVWGEPVALSAMFSEANKFPPALGLKVTEMLQVALAATVVQVVVSE